MNNPRSPTIHTIYQCATPWCSPLRRVPSPACVPYILWEDDRLLSLFPSLHTYSWITLPAFWALFFLSHFYWNKSFHIVYSDYGFPSPNPSKIPPTFPPTHIQPFLSLIRKQTGICKIMIKLEQTHRIGQNKQKQKSQTKITRNIDTETHIHSQRNSIETQKSEIIIYMQKTCIEKNSKKLPTFHWVCFTLVIDCWAWALPSNVV